MPSINRPLISSISLSNFFSFGPKPTEVKLGSLNVLIGPNGSGKSNFLLSVQLLKACVNGLENFSDVAGPFNELVWQGGGAQTEIGISAAMEPKYGEAVIHEVTLKEKSFDDSFRVAKEVIYSRLEDQDDRYLYRKEKGKSRILRHVNVINGDGTTKAQATELDMGQLYSDSVLAHPDSSDYLSPLRAAYRSFFVYQSEGVQHSREARKPQKTDLDQTYLATDGSNLANVVEALQHKPAVMAEIMSYVKRFYPKAIRLVPGLVGSSVRLFLEEEGLARTTPATRLSSGTIGFITLAVMLLHPNPPPVICLEQPEDGLHPDALVLLAEMLVKASQRTQVIVVTHSDILVSALSDHPESILVFEPGVEGTTVRRLDGEELKPWLEQYSLGDLWVSGEIGGVRR